MAEVTVEQAFDQAVRHHRAGELQKAEVLYRQIIAHRPSHIDALHLLGLVALQSNRAELAVDLIRRAVKLSPQFAGARYNLGNALRDQRQLPEAIAEYERALDLDPLLQDVYANLGNAYRALGQVDEAIAVYHRATALFEQMPEHYINLGNAFRQKALPDQAMAAYQKAIALDPKHIAAHMNLGVLLGEQGHLSQAIIEYQTAAALGPDLPEIHYNLGKALDEAGRPDQAIVAYQQAIALRPLYVQAQSNLGNSLRSIGELPRAISTLRHAVAIDPGCAEAWCNLGAALHQTGQMDDSVTASQRAMSLKPALLESYLNLGNVLRDKGQPDDALEVYRRAIAIKADCAQAHGNLGVVLKDKGRLDDAIIEFRTAMGLVSEGSDFHSSLLLTLNYHRAYDAKSIAAEGGRWNDLHAASLAKLIEPHVNDASPDRRLRIGYVSPDFRDHVVGWMMRPLFALRDREGFEIVCYAQVPCPDAVTHWFVNHSDSWRSSVGKSDEQLAAQIREDRIDILVDLALHTAGNRLRVFARKPAPVQVTFAGYPASTGLTAIDYRFSDPHLDPVGIDESTGREKVLRLPAAFWCCYPLDDGDISTNALPASSTACITFGCLGNFCKINDAVLELWAKVLNRVDHSRLLLMAPEGDHRGRTLHFLQARGIDRDRVEFVSRTSRRKYLELYHRIDIGLDSFPYNGHTTSLDSFWMGVPVITLVGQTAVGRAGLCQLSNLGLTELAALDEETFVKIAVELAGDLAKLAKLRSTLRTRMEQSPLMDAPAFALGIEGLFRQIWLEHLRQRCTVKTASP